LRNKNKDQRIKGAEVQRDKVFFEGAYPDRFQKPARYYITLNNQHLR